MTPTELSQLVKQCAVDAGFNQVGIAAAGPHPREDYLRRWLAGGRAGTMAYMHKHVESRIDVRAWLPDATHVIVVTVNYRQPPPMQALKRGGRIAMYAWGEDYHDVMRDKLEAMIAALRGRIDRSFFARACVDTSAITERELAAAAGIGWIGKNTLVLNESDGSYFFLGAILTDLPLVADPPATDHCGTCTRCLDVCPTGAFPAPYEMDARRCISYLTIEHRSEIDPALAAKMGDWLFGCDICQDVCPFNRRAPETSEPRFLVDQTEAIPDAAEMTSWTDAECRAFTRGKALSRAKPDMWRRNARIVLENDKSTDRNPATIEP